MKKQLQKSILIALGIITVIFISGCGGKIKNETADRSNNVEKNDVSAIKKDDMNYSPEDTSNWKRYKSKEYGILIFYPRDWVVQSYGDGGYKFEDKGINISWNGNSVTVFPVGKSESSCYSKRMKGDFERLRLDEYEEEFFIKASDDGRLYECSTDISNYPKSWNKEAFIEMNYDGAISGIVKGIVRNISFLEDNVDVDSLKLYGSRVGMQGDGNIINASDWLTEKNDIANLSFKYPKDAKIINQGNCYRVEYDLGFVIFFLPTNGDGRCGARTGVGILPDNVDVTDHLVIMGEKYEALGFNAVMDTKGEEFFKPETRYFYDFHHMFNLDKNENCGKASGCAKVGYGIFKETSVPLKEVDIDSTMNTLRAIIESVNTEM